MSLRSEPACFSHHLEGDMSPTQLRRSATMRYGRATILLAIPSAIAALVTCTDSRSPTATREPARAPDLAVAAGVAGAVTPQGTIPLPINQSTLTAAPNPAFGVTQTGTGPDG